MTIELTGAGGNPMAITDGVWDENGGPHLPEGSDGAVRNQNQVP